MPETYFSYLCQHYTSFNRTIFRPLISPQFTHFGCRFGCFRKYGNDDSTAKHEHKYQWPWQQQNYKHCNIVRVRAFFTTYKWPPSPLQRLLLVLGTEQPNIQSERHQTLLSDCKQTGIAVIFGNELDGRRCWWLSMTFPNWITSSWNSSWVYTITDSKRRLYLRHALLPTQSQRPLPVP